MSAWKKWGLLTVLLAILAAAPLCAADETPPEETTAEAPAEITPEDAALTVTAFRDRKILAVGKTLQLTATFSHPEIINAEAGNDRVLWQVRQKNGSQISPSQVKISAKGLLTASKQVKKGLYVVVTATSKAFGTHAEYEVFVYPPARRITVKPGAPVAFLGKEPLTVRAVTSPIGLQRTLIWRVKDSSIAKVKKNEDGTATVIPLKSGTTYLTAKSGNGAAARVKLTVAKPVSKITISGDSAVRKGSSIDLKAKLFPKPIRAMGVSWSVDVDGSMASIDSRGRLTVSKKCPVGTVITVSCWIKGSDGRVVGTKDITVTYARQRMDR